MKKIRELAEFMEEELHDAEKYAVLASNYRDEDIGLAEMYYNLAKGELDHMTKQHDRAVMLIQRFKEAGNEVPQAMQAIWDWEHKRLIEQKAKVVAIIGMYGK